MKAKYKKIIAFSLAAAVIAAVSAYTWLPGTKTVARQGVKATKAAAAHYLSTDAVDASNIRQVITADSTTSRTFMWQSDYAEENPVVEYRQAGDDDSLMQLPASSDAFSDDGVTTYIHTAAVSDLKPGTAYEYRVGAGDKRSDWQSFHTAQGHDFKALIFPDSQSSDYSVWAATAQPAWQRNQDAQFFINMGDLVDNGQDHYQWNAWFDVVGDMIARIPVVPLLGNHETYDKDWKVRMPEAYLHLFSLPRIDREKYQNQFYSFDYGDVHFVVLNTQSQELADFEPSLDEDEVAWFKEDMAKTTKKWKIVLMHKDPLQYGFANRPQPREEGFSPEGRLWMPLFDQYGVDAVLSAHLHTYRDRGHIRNFQRDESGPLYLITGVAGNVQYPGLWKQHSLDKYVAPQPETDNYMTLEATDDSLTFRSFLPDGQLLEEKSISSHK
ncbi:purple acid phosphatase family protein [Megasphaera sp.]|uniref:purple acid phosphatase family protein n=2 Tax=Megasphaera sp. TaxID=2023260 RepID=UPI0026171BB8|nr:metallophosphoesterase family protein [uncultured Megasphaera sp.]